MYIISKIILVYVHLVCSVGDMESDITECFKKPHKVKLFIPPITYDGTDRE